jgi:hypothetical protein
MSELILRVIEHKNAEMLDALLREFDIHYTVKKIGLGFSVRNFDPSDPSKSVDWLSRDLVEEGHEYGIVTLAAMATNRESRRLPFQYITMSKKNASRISAALDKIGLRHSIFPSMVEFKVESGEALMTAWSERAREYADSRDVVAPKFDFRRDFIEKEMNLAFEVPPPPYGTWSQTAFGMERPQSAKKEVRSDAGVITKRGRKATGSILKAIMGLTTPPKF